MKVMTFYTINELKKYVNLLDCNSDEYCVLTKFLQNDCNNVFDIILGSHSNELYDTPLVDETGIIALFHIVMFDNEEHSIIKNYIHLQISDDVILYVAINEDKKYLNADFTERIYNGTSDNEKLSVELIPAPLWNYNLRYFLSASEWRQLSKDVRIRKNYVCDVCGKDMSSQKRNCHAHEVWGYNDKEQIQYLKKIACLCDKCHMVKHIGKANADGCYEEAFNHYKKINGYTDEEAEARIKDAYDKWHERNNHGWRLIIDDDIVNFYSLHERLELKE